MRHPRRGCVARYGLSFTEVNVPSSNAAVPRSLLGFEWDGDCAKSAADDLLGRVVICDGREPTDAAVPAHDEQEQAEW